MTIIGDEVLRALETSKLQTVQTNRTASVATVHGLRSGKNLHCVTKMGEEETARTFRGAADVDAAGDGGVGIVAGGGGGGDDVAAGGVCKVHC